MQIKIGIISDPHATVEPLAEALEIFHQQGVQQILCAGDIAAYGDALDDTVELLKKYSCISVLGNHDVWHLEKKIPGDESAVYTFFESLPLTRQLHIAEQKLYMVHASPPDSLMDGIRLRNEYGEIMQDQRLAWSQYLEGFSFDVLVVGHSHQVYAEKLGNTLVVNPGSTLFNHSCAVLSLPSLKVEWFALSGQPILKSWNWSEYFKNNRRER